eukprot:4766735-Alexandrium_andersonii.AAC.1
MKDPNADSQSSPEKMTGATVSLKRPLSVPKPMKEEPQWAKLPNAQTPLKFLEKPCERRSAD